jgi:DNA mismatch repair protein MSH2
VKSDYCEQQQTVVDEVVNIACGYMEPLQQFCDVVAHLDVLASFAQVSAEAPVPYVRPTVLPKG